MKNLFTIKDFFKTYQDFLEMGKLIKVSETITVPNKFLGDFMTTGNAMAHICENLMKCHKGISNIILDEIGDSNLK